MQPGLNGHTLRGMATVGFTLFDTPIGRCGLAWGANGICDIELPGRTEQATPSSTARKRWACPWLLVRPTNAPRARGSHRGARSPSR